MAMATGTTEKIIEELRGGWMPSDIKDPAQWADARRILTRQTSAEPGPWRTDRVPYLRFPMECFAEPSIRTIVLKWATQTGKTELELNCMGYTIDVLGGSILTILPTDKTLDKYSRTRLMPMVDACPNLTEKKHPNHDLFQTAEMHYLDSIHYLATANSAADLKIVPVEFLFCDEVATFPLFAGKDADPVKLGMERQKTYSYTRKSVLVSSPTVEGGLISRYFDQCDLHYSYFVPCPHCGHFQTLLFSGIHWPDLGDTSEKSTLLKIKRAARYFCEECEKPIEDTDKPGMLARGEWRAKETDFQGGPESVAFHLNSIYSPFISWGDVAYEFLSSKNDTGQLMNFKNGWLAEEWVETVLKKEETQILQRRIDIPPLQCPEDTIALTCGVDPGQHGYWFAVYAWRKKDRRVHLVHYGFLPGLEDISQLFRENKYRTPEGVEFPIWRMGMDTGGGEYEDSTTTMTEAAYTFIRRMSSSRLVGTKGRSHKGARRMNLSVIDKMPNGQRIPGGLALWFLDSDAFKEILHYRLQKPIEEADAMTFHSGTDDEFAKQILAEEQRRNRKGELEWVQVSKKNHLLDATIIALAMGDRECQGGIDVLSRPQALPGERIKPVKEVVKPPDLAAVERRVMPSRSSGLRPSWVGLSREGGRSWLKG